MKLGFPEIIFTIVAIIAIVLVARLAGAGRGDKESNAKKSKGNPPVSRALIKKTGIIAIIIGVVFLMAAASLLRWALQSYLWAFIIILAGFILVFLSRKKR